MSPSEKRCQLRVAPLDVPLAVFSDCLPSLRQLKKTDRGRTGHGRDQTRGSLCVSALKCNIEYSDCESARDAVIRRLAVKPHKHSLLLDLDLLSIPLSLSPPPSPPQPANQPANAQLSAYFTRIYKTPPSPLNFYPFMLPTRWTRPILRS